MIEQFYFIHRLNPSGTITPGQSELESNANDGVLHIP